MISAELLKLRSRTMTKVFLIIIVVIIALANLLILAATKTTTGAAPQGATGALQPADLLSDAIPSALAIFSFFGLFLAAIFAASSVGNEYGWKTIRTELISSESRFKFLSAKLVALAIFIILGMLIAVAVGFVTRLITTGLGGYSFSLSFFTGTYAWNQFLGFWRTFFVIMPYALLGFMMAIVGRSAMPGIATSIGVFFLESIITAFMRSASGWISKVPNYLLSANVNAIEGLNNQSSGVRINVNGGTATALPSVPHAFIVLSIYSLAFLVLGYYLFKKRDVTG
jgi:ABC-type transport system involved in multi-copper enzyme maturation permease subunit